MISHNKLHFDLCDNVYEIQNKNHSDKIIICKKRCHISLWRFSSTQLSLFIAIT